MSEWRPRKWRKLHYDFATSKKLRRVGSDALALLATMIATAWWDDESSEGRMYDAEDVPTVRADLYIGAQLSFAKGEKAFAELERRKVVAMVDGLVVLPRFREHQRGDSGERMKRHRARHRDGGSDGDVTSRVTDSRMQSAEAEAENPSGSPRSPSKKTGPAKSEPTPGGASVANPETNASTPKPDPLAPAVKRVLGHLNAALVALGEPGRMSGAKSIRARLADGVDEADLCLEIDRRADECSRDKSQLAWLNTLTPFRPEAWEANLARARAWQRSRKPTGPRLDLSADDIAARRDEPRLPPISLRRKPDPEDEPNAAE